MPDGDDQECGSWREALRELLKWAHDSDPNFLVNLAAREKPNPLSPKKGGKPTAHREEFGDYTVRTAIDGKAQWEQVMRLCAETAGYRFGKGEAIEYLPATETS